MASGRVRLSLPAPLGLYVSERLPGLLERHPGLSVELIFREEPSDLIGDGIDLEVRLGAVSDSSLNVPADRLDDRLSRRGALLPGTTQHAQSAR